MKKGYLILVITFFVIGSVFLPKASATINFNNIGSLNFENKNLNLDFTKDLNKLSLGSQPNQPTLIQAQQAISGIIGFFGDVNNWLEQKAGIHLVPILKTIGSLFIFVVEKMIDLIKFGLSKI